MTGPPGGWMPMGPAGIVHGQTDPLDSSFSKWGTAPVSGRVTAIVADPSDPDNKVYVGTALGGVWKQVVDGDGTQHWEPLIDQESVITIGAMALSSAGDVLWAGTGDSALGGDAVVGRGVLRITLATGAAVRYYAGGNIVGLPSPPASPVASGLPAGLVVSRLVVDPSATDHVIAATTSGVFELAAMDQSFVEVQLCPTAGLPVTVPASDLIYDTTSTDPANRILWVAQTNTGGPVLSRRTGPVGPANYLVPANDSGMPAASGSRAVISQCAANPAVVYLGMATSWTSLGVWRTTGAPHGDTVPSGTVAWEELTGPAPTKGVLQAPYNLVLGVHPTQQDIVYLGEARLWRTKNGATTASPNPWEQCGTVTTTSQGIHWDQHVLYIDPRFGTSGTFDGIRLWAGNDGGVWRSVDGGTGFGARNRGLQTLQFFQLVSHPTARPVILAGAQDNGVLRSDGSGSWLEISQGDGCYVSIDPGQPTTWYQGYVSYPGPPNRTGKDFYGFQGIQRSTNAGAIGSFSIVAGPTPLTAGTADSIDPNDESLFYAPFMLIPSGTAGTAGELWLGTGRLYRSGDRGDHWQQVGPVLVAPFAGEKPEQRLQRGISAIASAPGHPERIYVGTFDGRLFRFDQPAGGTWPTGTAQTALELTAQDPPSGSPPNTPKVNALAVADPTLQGRFISDIAVVRNGADDRVVVALGLNHITGGAGQVTDAASLAVSEDSGLHFAAVTVETLTFPDGSTLDGRHNYANAVAIDPTQPALMYIGCDVGVFKYQIGVDPNPLAFNQGLPNAPVLDLDIWPRSGTATPKLLRAATHGRGIFETEPAAASPKTVDIFFRDDVVDDGRDLPTGGTSPDPFGTGTVSAAASPDVKIESDYRITGTPTRVSTTDYTPAGPLDFIGFASMAEGTLVGGRSSTVWVQVHNRGTAPATNVQVRAYWAEKTGGNLPDLPTGFWTGFPGSDPPASAWKPLGPAMTIATVRPGEPALASWSWTLPGLGAGTDAGLLVAVTSAEDAILQPSSSSTPEAAQQSKYVAYRDVSTGMPVWEIVTLIVAGVGLGVAAGVGGYALSHSQH
ncbi:MAG: hypothetical protein ACRDYY_14970 [Acidimicrobiales bacterium]